MARIIIIETGHTHIAGLFSTTDFGVSSSGIFLSSPEAGVCSSSIATLLSSDAASSWSCAVASSAFSPALSG